MERIGASCSLSSDAACAAVRNGADRVRRELSLAVIVAIWSGALVESRAPAAFAPPAADLSMTTTYAAPSFAAPSLPTPGAPLALDTTDVERDREQPGDPCPGSSAWSVAPQDAPAPAAAGESPATLHVPVLMYHHVLPSSQLPAGERYPDLFVDPVVFDAQMAALKAAGWRTVTTRQLWEAMWSGLAIPTRTVVITFDDGRPDQYTYAFPILERYGFSATFFIVPGRIGTSQHMTACQLREIAAAGNELADHTWNHADLTTLTLEQARSRIRAAADAIKSLVGVRPVTIAYPFGRYNSTVEAAARAEGMDLAFTTRHGALESIATRLAEPRLRVNGLERRPDGSYGSGSTGRSILWLLSPYAGS